MCRGKRDLTKKTKNKKKARQTNQKTNNRRKRQTAKIQNRLNKPKQLILKIRCVPTSVSITKCPVNSFSTPRFARNINSKVHKMPFNPAFSFRNQTQVLFKHNVKTYSITDTCWRFFKIEFLSYFADFFTWKQPKLALFLLPLTQRGIETDLQEEIGLNFFFVLFFFLKVHDFCRFKPCFPGVPCFNDPASLQGFECGECPLGMVGNGVNCSDVDEVNIKMITLSGNRSSVYRQSRLKM